MQSDRQSKQSHAHKRSRYEEKPNNNKPKKYVEKKNKE